MVGRPRDVVDALPAYRPGKAAAQAEAEHGITDAIKLASNENPSAPLPAVREAIAAAISGLNRYADHRATALRERIAGWLDVSVDHVTVGNGSVGLLQQLALTYVEPGDEVVYPWRSFEVYPVFTQLAGGSSVQTALVDHRFDLDAVADAITEQTKLVLLATPNNPTGTAVTTEDLNALLGRVPDRVVVAIDEAYREFVGPDVGDPVTEVLPHHANAVVLRTFSKAYGLAGLRAGYAIGNPEVVSSIDKTLVPFAVNALAQEAAIAAIDHVDAVMDNVATLLAERRRVADALTATGWSYPASHANFIYLPLGERTDAVYVDLERRGVVTRPFSGEGIRVTVGDARENDRFLSALDEVATP